MIDRGSPKLENSPKLMSQKWGTLKISSIPIGSVTRWHPPKTGYPRHVTESKYQDKSKTQFNWAHVLCSVFFVVWRFFFKDIYERQFLVFLISYFRPGTRSRSCNTWSLPTADSAPSATPFTAQTLLAYLSWDNIQWFLWILLYFIDLRTLLAKQIPKGCVIKLRLTQPLTTFFLASRVQWAEEATKALRLSSRWNPV